MKKNILCRLFTAGAALIFSAMAAFPAFSADPPMLSGSLEAVTETAVTGWAFNRLAPDEKVTVEIAVYGEGGPGSCTLFTAEASLPRDGGTESGTENSAFSCTIDWSKLSGDTFTVMATAISGTVRQPLSQSLEYKKSEPVQSYAEGTAAAHAEAGELLGTFIASGYCNCKKCSGGSSLTYSGTVPKARHTIAADLDYYPIGTRLFIDGVVYTVEDMGSGIEDNRLDIYFETHDEALAFGLQSITVYSVR